MSSQVSQFGKSYLKTYSLASSFSQGWLRYCNGFDGPKAIVHRMMRDVDENSFKCFAEEYLLDRLDQKSSIKPISTYNLQSNPKFVLTDVSPSGLRKVMFYNTGIGSGGTKKEGGCSVEISLSHNGDEDAEVNYKVDLSSYHGKIIGDSWFGGCSWSFDEKYFVYVAQSKSPSIKTVVEVLGEETCEKLLVESRNKFEFVEDWGEKYVDVADLKLFILNICSGIVKEVEGIDVASYTVGQPQFLFPLQNDEQCAYRLAYTAWDNAPRKLGMIYCYQRKAKIFMMDATKCLRGTEDGVQHVLVSPGVAVARSARSSPNGKYLVFLGNEKGHVSHGGCSELFCVDVVELLSANQDQSKWLRKVVSQVDQPYNKHSLRVGATKSFPGLFLDQLPRQCFIAAGEEVMLNTAWESCERLVRVCLSSGMAESQRVGLVSWQEKHRAIASHNVTEMEEMCFQVLDCLDQHILGAVQSPIHPPRLVLLSLSPTDTAEVGQVTLLGNDFKHYAVSCRAPLVEFTPPRQSMLFQVFRHQSAGDDIVFNSILLCPSSHKDWPAEGRPVVIVPHGGPHSVMTNAFVPAYVYLAETLGAVVLHVNYRGSTGFGQDSVESLLGKVGSQDVADMMQALEHALQLQYVICSDGKVQIVDPTNNLNGDVHSENAVLARLINKERVGVVGGSHGGFLGAHLCGQYPTVFRACCLRNPVTNIPAMSSVTDIPDWCHVEASGKHTMANLNAGAVRNEDLVRMRDCSPIAHIEQYHTPTLICLGAKDRRVPCSQGVEFYHLLKAKQVPTRLMIFPEDVHAIDLPTSEAEHWIAICQWIATYI